MATQQASSSTVTTSWAAPTGLGEPPGLQEPVDRRHAFPGRRQPQPPTAMTPLRLVAVGVGHDPEMAKDASPPPGWVQRLQEHRFGLGGHLVSE